MTVRHPLLTSGLLDQATQTMRQAIPLADQVGHRALIVNGLVYAGFTATWQGRFRAAVSACHDAVQVAEAAHDAEHLAAAPFCLALALAGCGEYEAALAGLHDLLAFANTTGEPYYAVHAQHHRLDLSRVGTHRASSALG